MENLKTSIKSFSFVTAGRLILRGGNILKTVFVAKILGLTPNEFGLFGIAVLVAGLIEIITETGINVFLLQEKEPVQKYQDTAWVISIWRGLFIFIIIFLSAPLIATLFHSPQALNLIRLISLVPLIRGLIHPACISFQKILRFDSDFYYRSLIVFIELLFTAIFTLYYRNAYGLVWGLIFSAVFETLLSLLLFRPLPKFILDKIQARLILSRGKFVTAYGIFDYLYTNGDNIIVGLLLGYTALGLYQNAYRISTLAASETMGIFYKVSLPNFVQISHDKKALFTASKKYLLPYSLLLIFINLVVFFFADFFVHLLLGPAWIMAVPLVKILSFMGTIRAVTYSFNALFISLKLQQNVTIITLTSMTVLLISLVPFIHLFGLVGAGYSALLASISALPVTFYFLKKTHP